MQFFEWLSRRQKITSAGEDTEEGTQCALLGMYTGEPITENSLKVPQKN